MEMKNNQREESLVDVQVPSTCILEKKNEFLPSTDPVNSSTYALRYLSVLDQELTCVSLSRLLVKLLSEKCSSTLRNVSSYQENIISMRQRSFAGNLASFSQWSICLTNGYFASDIFTDRSISINKLNRSMWLAPAA